MLLAWYILNAPLPSHARRLFKGKFSKPKEFVIQTHWFIFCLKNNNKHLYKKCKIFYSYTCNTSQIKIFNEFEWFSEICKFIAKYRQMHAFKLQTLSHKYTHIFLHSIGWSLLLKCFQIIFPFQIHIEQNTYLTQIVILNKKHKRKIKKWGFHLQTYSHLSIFRLKFKVN